MGIGKQGNARLREGGNGRGHRDVTLVTPCALSHAWVVLEQNQELSFHRRHQFLRRWHFDPVPPSAAQNGSRDRIEFRRIAALNIFLHRAAHIRRRCLHPGEDRFRIYFGALSHGHRTRLPHASLALSPPLRIGQNLADSLIRGGRTQRKRRQDCLLYTSRCV